MRSFGEFSAVDAIRSQQEFLVSGGGHAAAGGCTVKKDDLAQFREGINAYYRSLKLVSQEAYLLPEHDVAIDSFKAITVRLCELVETMQPFGRGNPYPLLLAKDCSITVVKRVGSDKAHVQLEASDADGESRRGIAFSLAEEFTPKVGDRVDLWFEPQINEYAGRKTPQLMIKRVAPSGHLG